MIITDKLNNCGLSVLDGFSNYSLVSIEDHITEHDQHPSNCEGMAIMCTLNEKQITLGLANGLKNNGFVRVASFGNPHHNGRRLSLFIRHNEVKEEHYKEIPSATR